MRPNTHKNTEAGEIFSPNRWQIESAARRALGDLTPAPPRRRLVKSPSVLFLLVLLAFIGSYLIVRVFAW